MIKRYEESASGMIEDDEYGTYVDYFAYLELEAENQDLRDMATYNFDTLTKANAQLVAENQRLREALEVKDE